MTKVLITGERGYIATRLAEHLLRSGGFTVKLFSVRNGFSSYDLLGYDAVVHAAALVHQKSNNIPYEKYYEVNTQLTCDLAESAAAAGAGQFVFLSTMALYEGLSRIGTNELIDGATDVSFFSSYASTKFGAEESLKEFGDDLTISVVRPPLVYGEHSPGNFLRLARLAKRLPFFPSVENRRSMIYIENLCELIRLILINKSAGTFCPQNAEHVSTSKLFRDLASLQGNDVRLIKFPRPLVSACSASDPFRRMFADLAYDKKFSSCFDNAYQTVGYEESLIRSLRGGG